MSSHLSLSSHPYFTTCAQPCLIHPTLEHRGKRFLFGFPQPLVTETLAREQCWVRFPRQDGTPCRRLPGLWCPARHPFRTSLGAGPNTEAGELKAPACGSGGVQVTWNVGHKAEQVAEGLHVGSTELTLAFLQSGHLLSSWPCEVLAQPQVSCSLCRPEVVQGVPTFPTLKSKELLAFGAGQPRAQAPVGRVRTDRRSSLLSSTQSDLRCGLFIQDLHQDVCLLGAPEALVWREACAWPHQVCRG